MRREQERRRLDGSPLTEADRRFWALRDSGYNGPIDQDGYASDEYGNRTHKTDNQPN